ncbi:MAG TPA: hypothetical protein VG817_12205 [Gemmatimonadales bacterium]|nr:hypothetical protein [Gemmatimonadales bacterium]
MRLRTLLALLVSLFLLLNAAGHFLTPQLALYAPVWGRISITSPLGLALTVLGCLATIALAWWGPAAHLRVNRRLALWTIVLSMITSLQFVTDLGEFTTMRVNRKLTLCNFTPLPDSSLVLRTLAKEAAKDLDELGTMFAIPDGEPVQLCVFASRPQFLTAISRTPDDGHEGLYNPLTSTIYVPLSRWPATVRHELVHHFQKQRARRSLRTLVQSLTRETRLKQESLAYFLAPEGSPDGWRALDYLNATQLTDSTITKLLTFRGGLGKATGRQNRGVVESANLLLATYPWYATGNPEQAIALYDEPAEKLRQALRDLRSYPRDTLAEQYFQYLMAGSLPMTRPAEHGFVSLPGFRKMSRAYGDSLRRGIAEWNRDRRTVLEHRIEWEVVLDTLNTGAQYSKAGQIFRRAHGLLSLAWNSEEPTALGPIAAVLKAYLAQSQRDGYRALSAWLYYQWLQLEYVRGGAVAIPPADSFSGEYGLYYTEMIDRMLTRIRSRSP